MITRKELYENQKRCELNIAAVAQTFPVDTEKLRKYFISYDEANRITKLVIENELPYDTYDKIETPKISINVSPQASGKTVLNDYAIKKMGKENCILINSVFLCSYVTCAPFYVRLILRQVNGCNGTIQSEVR